MCGMGDYLMIGTEDKECTSPSTPLEKEDTAVSERERIKQQLPPYDKPMIESEPRDRKALKSVPGAVPFERLPLPQERGPG